MGGCPQNSQKEPDMKVFGKWLLYQQNKEGKKAIVTWGDTKKSLESLIEYNLKKIGKNLWTNNESIFWIEKNTKEYR